MYCSKCGIENKNSNKYCYNCGNKLNIKNSVTSSGYKETSLVLGIICLISSMFLSVIGFIPGIISLIYGNKYKKESGSYGTGFVLSIIGIIIGILELIFIIMFFMFVVNFGYYEETNDFNLENVNNVYDNNLIQL